MKCREYVFLLTSGQLAQRGNPLQRSIAAAHWVSCPSCRRFTHNDRTLSRVVRVQKQKWLDDFTG